MLKTLVVFGTRPEAIKMAPLVGALQKKSKNRLPGLHHRPAQADAGPGAGGFFRSSRTLTLISWSKSQTLSDITIRALSGLENIIREVDPAIVLVHGDTTTTFAGSLAAYYQQVPIGHVEAGLRTWKQIFSLSRRDEPPDGRTAWPTCILPPHSKAAGTC